MAVKAIDLLDIAEIRREKAIRCKESFAYFLKQAWHVIEPARPLTWGIHTEAVCAHLQAVGDGKLHRLVANIAPGFGKSSTFSVAFPAWIWTRNPQERFLCASYAMDLAIRDNRNCRMLIESEWYQLLFGDVFQMAGDQNVKSFYENNKRGYRLCTAVRSSGTGKRGTCLIIDDPNNGMAGRAEVEATVEWFGKTWSSRLNDQENGWMIVVGQRLYSNDLTNHVLSLGDWEHLNLPTEYEPARKCYTSIGWEDPRTREGELLCSALLNAQSIVGMKASLGGMNYAAQFQQSPVPSGGGQFRKEWLRYFTESDEAYLLETPNGIRSVLKSQCWLFVTGDLAISSKQSADYTVFAVWAVTSERDLILIDLVRGHLSNPEQIKQLRLLHYQYPSAYFRIERVGYQLSLIQQALAEGIPCREYNPVRDKVSRASTAAIWMENGKIYFRKGAAWITELESELLLFPKAAHDDIVDNCSMAADEVVTPHMPLSGEEVQEAEVIVPTLQDLVTRDAFEYASQQWGDWE